MKIVGFYMSHNNIYYVDGPPEIVPVASSASDYEGWFTNEHYEPFHILGVLQESGRLFPFIFRVDGLQEVRIRFERILEDRVVLEVEENG